MCDYEMDTNTYELKGRASLFAVVLRIPFRGADSI